MMKSWYVSVMQRVTNPETGRPNAKVIFNKQCITVKEANELLAAKKEEYKTSPVGEFIISKDNY